MISASDAAHARWMDRCEELARQAQRAGNTPVGAVLVLDGVAIAEAAEESPAGPRPFAHAEILVVEQALRLRPRPDLREAILYSTAEPCILCGYAVREARIGRLVLARSAGEIGSIRSRFPVLTADWVDRWGPPPAVVWFREGIGSTPPDAR
ncbi:MAG TPA: deaminase [Gemmatimonadaceae bacterium]|nr:deaminase [Gemmatimonadaceae bacterium]